MQSVHPIASCSKASRGLFVQLRVKGIFTPLAISPSPSSRQSPTRYAIRAGQNSPDKEFRYLRTVIVTAGVHRRLDSKLRCIAALSPLLLTFRHWPGISSYTSPCGLAGTCVFGKQSVGGRLLRALLRGPGLIPKLRPLFCRVPKRWFSRSPWHACAYPPVSVYGTVPVYDGS